MVIHHTYHFDFPDKVLSLPSLVKKHQKANRDSEQRVSHDFDQRSPRVLVQPEIRQTSEKEDAKTSKNAPQRSNPTRNCTVSNHGSILPPSAAIEQVKTINDALPAHEVSNSISHYVYDLMGQAWLDASLDCPAIHCPAILMTE
jgi:hypothetical protein